MSKTKIWSLQFSCRRLAREARSLGRSLDPTGQAARDIEHHLAEAAQLLGSSMEQAGQGPPKGPGGGVLDLAQLAFGDNAWANQSPLTDYKAPQESSPSPKHKLGMRVAAHFVATPDLITFLCSMKKTGVLLVDTQDERFTIELDQGDIVHAHSDGAPEGERLGDVLVETGVVKQADLENLLAEGIRGRFGGRLGARLLDRKLATPEDLTAALETQIRRLFHRLFTATATDFVFWEGPCVWGESSMRLNATMLLLDGARAIDESSRDAHAVAEQAIDDAEAAIAAAGATAAGAEGSWLLDGEHAAPAAVEATATTAASVADSPVPTETETETASASAATVAPTAETHTEAPAASAVPAAAAEPAASELATAAEHPSHPLSPTPARGETDGDGGDGADDEDAKATAAAVPPTPALAPTPAPAVDDAAAERTAADDEPTPASD